MRREGAGAWVVCHARRDAGTTRPIACRPRRRDRARLRPRRAATGCHRPGKAERWDPRRAERDAAMCQPRRWHRRRWPASRTSDGAGRLELGHNPCDRSRPAASDQLKRLLIVERLDRPREPYRNVVGLDDASEPVDDLGQLGDPLRTLPRRGGAARKPVAHRARRRTDSPPDLGIREPGDFVDPNDLLSECRRHAPNDSPSVASPSSFRRCSAIPLVSSIDTRDSRCEPRPVPTLPRLSGAPAVHCERYCAIPYQML